MPKAGGLDDVVQRFDADTSGYVKGADEVVIAAIRMAKEDKQAIDTIIATHKQMSEINVLLKNDMSSMLGIVRENSSSVKDYVDNIDRLNRGYEQIRTQTEYMRSAGDLYSGMRDSARSLSDELETHIVKLNAVKNAADDAGNAIAAAAAGVAAGGSGARGGGGSGWSAAAAAAAAAAAGGGGGANAAGFGAVATVLGANTAAGHWAVVSGALSTWLPRIHYAMMAFNELASTVGPALIAGGAATMVGWQGGEVASRRYEALNTVQEALGGSVNQTAASFVGLKSNLQAAQNAANTGVWELAGAAINSLTGKTSGFTQMGTNTIAMLDTFAAKATLAFKSGGGAAALQQITSQGTHYLQQFGQIAGNIGTTFLHVAPNLPGVGSDLISTLQGATKAASWATGAIPGGILGTGLAAEAGARYGPTIVGALGAALGKAPGGILGTAAHAATADEIAAAAARGEVINAGETVAGTGLAGALGSVKVPQLAIAAAAAYLIGKTATAQSPLQQHLATLQGGIDQSLVGGGGINAVIGAMGQVGPVGGPQTMAYGSSVAKAYSDVFSSHFFKGLQEVFQTGWGSVPGAVGTTRALGFGGSGFGTGIAGDLATPAAYNKQALDKMAGSFNNILTAGQQVSKMMGVSLPDAFGLTQQALLQVGNAFDKHGNLTAAAKQQIANLQSGYEAMNTTTGVFGKNVGAVNVANGLAATQVSNVNTAWDQFTNNAVQGAVGASSLAQNLALAHPTIKATAQALSGFGPGSAAAWAAFASPNANAPGLLQQSQSQADWIRIAQTSGAVSGAQGAGMTAYLAKQLLPYGAKSPLAASAIGILGQQAGMPSGLDQKQQTAWLDKHTMSQKQYNQAVAEAGVTMASVSGQAAHFGQTVQASVVSAMEQGAVNLPKMTTDMGKLAKSFTPSGGFGGSALKTVASDLHNVGLNLQSAQAIVSNAMASHGIKDTGAAMAAVKSQYAKIDVQVEGAAKVAVLKADMSSLHDKIVKAQAETSGTPSVNALKTALATLQSKTVTAEAVALGRPAIVALGNAIAALQSKTVYATTIVRTIVESTGTQISFQGVGSGNETASIQGSPLRLHAQTGMLVPGFGSGDHVPALLEPGEAIVPRYLVPLIAPILKSHHVPGFAAGGIIPAGTLSGVNSQISSEWKILDQMYASSASKAAVNNFWKTILDPLYAAKDAFKGIATHAAAISKATSKLADTLTGKFTTAMNFARGVSGAASAGQGFGTAGLISGMDPTQDTVANQMQAYLTSEKAFTTDLKTLTKGGLNKSLIQQLIAAGPTQGDALAQSILQGGGTSGTGAGISQVNQLWKQIGSASHALGSQAAMSVYGQTIAPNLKSGNVTSNNISISVNVPAGSGANLALTTAQIKQITAEVQAALLKQAKRNRTTGVALAGKKA